MTKPTPTPQQEACAKQMRGMLRKHMRNRVADDPAAHHRGITFKAPKGFGKTLTMGLVNKGISKKKKVLSLYIACKSDHAEKQAEQVGVAAGDKPLTVGRLYMLKASLANGKGSATFALTPTSGGALLNPDHKLNEGVITTATAAGVEVIHLIFDEGHKGYKGRHGKPALVAAFRRKLGKKGIDVHVTSVTDTPLWDVKGKEQPRLAQRACTFLGLEVGEGEEAVDVLSSDETMVAVTSEDAKDHFAITKPLQTAPPERFERREVAIPSGAPTQELKAYVGDAKQLLLGLALDCCPGPFDDRTKGFRIVCSKANVQKVLDDYTIESVLPKDGVQCRKVEEEADGSLKLSDEVLTVRANAIIVADTPEARAHLEKELKDRADNDEGARPMEFFDFTTKDRATLDANIAAFHEATTRMKSGHPIGFMEPSQLEGSDEFGKNVFAMLAIGAFQPHLLNQGAGRMGRPVTMKAGDLVPVGGYKAVHLASSWQTKLGGALLKASLSEADALPDREAKLLTDYKAARKKEREELFGELDGDEPDPVLERVAATAKKLAKIDASKHLSEPFDLAKTYLEAEIGSTSDEEKGEKEMHLEHVFGRGSLEGRNREGSVLGKYLGQWHWFLGWVSTPTAEDGEGDEAVMDDEPADSDQD